MAAKRIRSVWERMGLVKGKGAFVTHFPGYQRRERAPFSFRAAKDKYERCGMVAAGIDAVVERVVGAGGTPSFHLTCPDEAALKIVEDFVEECRLDLEVRVWVFEHRLYGGSFVEKLYRGNKLVGVQTLPILTMEDSIVPLKTRPGPEKYVQQVTGAKPEWKPEQIIHFRRNPNTASSYGYSVIQPINDALDILLDAEEDMGKIIKRYAAPKIAWMLEDATKTTYDEVKTALETIKPDEDYLITTMGGTKVKADILQIDPRARFEYFINHLVNEIAAGLECPVTHLFRGDIRISDASATQMMDAFNQAIQSTQHYFKRKIELEIFKPLIEQEGLTEVPELHWGPVEEPEINMADIVSLAKISADRELAGLKPILRVDELRKMLSEYGFHLKEDEEETEVPEEEEVDNGKPGNVP